MKICSVCKTYSRSLGRCILGKIVPKTIKGGRDAVQFMGASYICPKTPGYQKIVFRAEKWSTEEEGQKI